MGSELVRERRVDAMKDQHAEGTEIVAYVFCDICFRHRDMTMVDVRNMGGAGWPRCCGEQMNLAAYHGPKKQHEREADA
jgi:hypothetical protein